MSAAHFMHGWINLLGSLATIALIVTALGIMLSIVKPADAPKRIGAILSIVILLILIPGILASAWSGMSFWQQIGLVAIGIVVWQWRRPQRQVQRKNKNKHAFLGL